MQCLASPVFASARPSNELLLAGSIIFRRLSRVTRLLFLERYEVVHYRKPRHLSQIASKKFGEIIRKMTIVHQRGKCWRRALWPCHDGARYRAGDGTATIGAE
jgi:hypothetical protein